MQHTATCGRERCIVSKRATEAAILGYQEHQYSRECLLVVSKYATGLNMHLGVHVKQKITIPCPPPLFANFRRQVTPGTDDIYGHISRRAPKLLSSNLGHYVY